jgi:CreA protein
VEAENGETARHARPVTVAEALEASEAARRVLLRRGGGARPYRVVRPNRAAKAGDEPDLIFKRSTVFKLLTPNDKLATYGLDDPEVEGVACHFTVPERGGVKGWLGVAEEVSDISLACRQIGPIRFKAKFEQGEDVFRKRRSLFFKKMQIVRGCDAKRNVLVYMVYSDRLIEGSPKNSTSSVPIMPWGQNDQIQKCADFLEK